MTTKFNNYNTQTYNDDILLRKIATSLPGDFQYGKYLKEYNKRISENRLFFLHNRGTLGAAICNFDSLYMEKKLESVLRNRRFNQ